MTHLISKTRGVLEPILKHSPTQVNVTHYKPHTWCLAFKEIFSLCGGSAHSLSVACSGKRKEAWPWGHLTWHSLKQKYPKTELFLGLRIGVRTSGIKVGVWALQNHTCFARVRPPDWNPGSMPRSLLQLTGWLNPPFTSRIEATKRIAYLNVFLSESCPCSTAGCCPSCCLSLLQHGGVKDESVSREAASFQRFAAVVQCCCRCCCCYGCCRRCCVSQRRIRRMLGAKGDQTTLSLSERSLWGWTTYNLEREISHGYLERYSESRPMLLFSDGVLSQAILLSILVAFLSVICQTCLGLFQMARMRFKSSELKCLCCHPCRVQRLNTQR